MTSPSEDIGVARWFSPDNYSLFDISIGQEDRLRTRGSTHLGTSLFAISLGVDWSHGVLAVYFISHIPLDRMARRVFRPQFPAVTVPEDMTLPQFVLLRAQHLGDKAAFVRKTFATNIIFPVRFYAKAPRRAICYVLITLMQYTPC